MYTLNVTIAVTGQRQQFIPPGPVINNSNTGFQNLILQNNGAAIMAFGDQTVSLTNGILLSPGTAPPGGTITAIMGIAYVSDLKDFWVVGTAGDRLNIMVFG